MGSPEPGGQTGDSLSSPRDRRGGPRPPGQHDRGCGPGRGLRASAGQQRPRGASRPPEATGQRGPNVRPPWPELAARRAHQAPGQPTPRDLRLRLPADVSPPAAPPARVSELPGHVENEELVGAAEPICRAIEEGRGARPRTRARVGSQALRPLPLGLQPSHNKASLRTSKRLPHAAPRTQTLRVAPCVRAHVSGTCWGHGETAVGVEAKSCPRNKTGLTELKGSPVGRGHVVLPHQGSWPCPPHSVSHRPVQGPLLR